MSDQLIQRTFFYERTRKTGMKEDVSLPVYSKHDLDRTVIYRKLFARTEHGYTIQFITIDEDGEISFKEESQIGNDLGINADYYLGKMDFASSKSEWADALQKAKRTLSFYEP